MSLLGRLKNLKNFLAKRKLLALGTFALLSLFAFQNCGRFDISQVPDPEQVIESLSYGITGALNEPARVRAHTRLVFLVDHSNSMIFQGCFDDLDGSQPSVNPTPCQPAGGYDTQGKRYDVIRQWLVALKNSEEPDVKVLLLPFSGGVTDEKRIRDEKDKLEFTSLDTAIARIDELKAEQLAEMQNANMSAANKKMGTTVPLRFLTLAQSKMDAEMRALLSSKQLYSTLFEFYYISDGIYKPQKAHIEKAMELAKCPMDCVLDSKYVRCNSLIDDKDVVDNQDGEIIGDLPLTEDLKNKVKKCAGENNFKEQRLGNNNKIMLVPDACFCLSVGNATYRYFGRDEENNHQKVSTTLVGISGLANYFMQGQVNMNFVSVLDLSQNTPPYQLNLFNEYKKIVPTANITTLADMEQLIPRAAVPIEALTYRVDKFYVVNLNAHQKFDGSWAPDSDADGVSDEEEVTIGTNPLLERSTVGAELCLDGVAKNYGCRLSGCYDYLDSDGDGLNDCEKKTLTTSGLKRDTSEDGIIDYFKVIKGLNPLLDANITDTNTDSITDDQAFRWGLSPYVNYNVYIQGPPENVQAVQPHKAPKIETVVQFKGYQETSEGNIPIYTIAVSGIPLVPTLAYTKNSVLYFDKLKLDQVDDSQYLGPISRKVNDNDVLFIVQIRANEMKERVHWLVLRKHMPYNSGGNIQLDLNQFVELRTMRLGL